jgi:hypothetical protein
MEERRMKRDPYLGSRNVPIGKVGADRLETVRIATRSAKCAKSSAPNSSLVSFASV